MRRIFWMGVGVTVTVLVIRKGKQMRAKYSPPAIVHRALDDLEQRTDALGGRLVYAARGFTTDVKVAMTRREGELRGAVLSHGQQDPDDVRRARAAAKEAFPGDTGPFLTEDDDDLPYSF